MRRLFPPLSLQSVIDKTRPRGKRDGVVHWTWPSLLR